MARPTRTDAYNATERNPKPGDEAVQQLYALLASATNPDGTPFALPVEDPAAAGGIGDTLEASSSATTPLANAVLAAITAPPAGVYRVNALIALTGTAEVARQNLRLRQNAANVGGLLLTLTDRVLSVEFPRVTVAGGNIDLLVVAAATAGAIYNALLTATRIA